MKTFGVYACYRDALAIKSAELWLRLGQRLRALAELECVSAQGRKSDAYAQVQRAVSEPAHGLLPQPAA